MDYLINDPRYGFRMLLKRPGPDFLKIRTSASRESYLAAYFDKLKFVGTPKQLGDIPRSGDLSIERVVLRSPGRVAATSR